MSTTADEVYRRIRDAIADILNDLGVSASRVSVTSEPNIDINNPYQVQVGPAGASASLPRPGLGLVDDRVEIATWVRVFKDSGGRADWLVSGDGLGVLRAMQNAYRALQNNTLNDLLIVPLRHISTSRPTRSPRAEGYVVVRSIFACSYELGTDRAYLGWSATAPGVLTGLSGLSLDEAVAINRVSGGSEYVWCLTPQAMGDVVFWHEAGRVEFFSNLNEPPSGPTCGTVTIGGVVYRRWRSPYATAGRSAVYRVRRR